MIAGAKQALTFARGEQEHGCIVHTPEALAMQQLEAFLGPRIAEAECGEAVERSGKEIFAELRATMKL